MSKFMSKLDEGKLDESSMELFTSLMEEKPELMVHIYSCAIQTEREINRQRVLEGMAAAKARGVKFGRRPKDRPATYEAVLAQWRSGRISGRKAAQLLDIAPATFRRWANE